jgi:chemotaxis protein MotB
MSRLQRAEEKKRGAPAYMVSFGDMMTLILCFFILLVSMAEMQNYGLLAKGIGSFIVAVESHGLNGILSAHERHEIFEAVRRRFNLPPEEDPERREAHVEASSLELLRAEVLEALTPHHELRQPRVASFDEGSAVLDTASRDYLDRLATSLRPAPGQLLILEGHAYGPEGNDDWLAFRRAAAVREYLVGEHAFRSNRVEARAWIDEVVDPGAATRAVDARLVTPIRERP